MKSRDSFIWRAFSLMSQNLHSSRAPQYWQLRKIVMNEPKGNDSHDRASRPANSWHSSQGFSGSGLPRGTRPSVVMTSRPSTTSIR